MSVGYTPRDCGRPCSETTDSDGYRSDVRKWSRKNSLSGLKLRSEMDAREAGVLRSLVGAVSGLLTERASSAPDDDLAALTGLRTGNATPPDDPRLLRLLPDFHRSEPGSPDADRADLNSALRSLHEPEIIDAKLAAGAVVLDTCPSDGGRIIITPEQADAWLTALTDVRLALGAVLGIDADTPEQFDPDDPRAPHLDVYHWLTWMQDSLLQALAP
ncbi:oxidative stress transcriptional regulator AosR [Nocardia cyriacigeorgica]|uniref:oxidative stress transcriptional regulator AosR n=1 Tax=Nocardia cyriacigeorgica TaxID=135487 RepID=UPI00397F336E